LRSIPQHSRETTMTSPLLHHGCAALASLGVVLMSGCAAMQGGDTETMNPGPGDSDAVLIRAIESAARANGARVIWVNPPKARAPQASPRNVVSNEAIAT
jgi:hypothetical protein